MLAREAISQSYDGLYKQSPRVLGLVENPEDDIKNWTKAPTRLEQTSGIYGPITTNAKDLVNFTNAYNGNLPSTTLVDQPKDRNQQAR